MKEFDYDEYLSFAEVPSGAIIDVASDLLSLMRYCRQHDLRFDADNLIDALKRMAGSEGTVMIRTFSWAFCRGASFDIRTTKSEVGALGNVALKRPDFRRTKHPIYSWMVWGRHQEELCAFRNVNSFGEGSVFDYLDKARAIQLIVGIPDDDGDTMSHHAEVMGGVPYRKEKFFEADYIDEAGNRTHDVYSMHVRPLNIEVSGKIRDSAESMERYVKQGILKYHFYKNDMPITTMDEHLLYEFIKNDIQNNDGKNTMSVNGIPGIQACGVDWNEAVYY